MATELETLLIRVEADTRRLQNNMKRAERALDQSSGKMSRGMRRFDTALNTSTTGVNKLKVALAAAVPALTIAGLVKLSNASLDFADRIAKVADKVGFTTDQLQELRFAAEQAGVGANTLDMALQRFSRRVGEASQGSGELYDTLKQYNIGVLDSTGKTRANIDILGDLSNAIKNAKSDQEALRIAFKAFDSEGAALVTMLRKGSDGLDKMRQDARDLGIVMDEKLIRQGEAARSKLDALWYVLQAKLAKTLVELAPQIVSVANALFDVAKAALDAFDGISRFLGLGTRATGIAKLQGDVTALKRGLDSLGGSQVFFTDPLPKDVQDRIKKEVGTYAGATTTIRPSTTSAIAKILQEELDRRVAQITAQSLDPFGGRGPTMPSGAPAGRSVLPPKKGAGSTTKSPFQNLTTDIQKRINAMVLEQEQMGKNAAEVEKLRLAHQLWNFEAEKGANLTEAQRTQLEQLQELYNNHVDRLEAVRQKHEQLIQTNQVLQQGYDQVASTITDGLFGAFENGVQSFKDAGKQMLQMLAKLLFQLAVVNTLKNALFGGKEATLGSIFKSLGGAAGGFAGAGASFAGTRAGGGPVSAGKSYLVGEKGPELFQPKMSGNIVANGQSSGGATYFVDATGASRAEFEKFKAWVLHQNGRVEERAVAAFSNHRARVLA